MAKEIARADFGTQSLQSLSDAKFADYTVTDEHGANFKVNPQLVSCHSVYFKKIFEGDFKEVHEKSISLQGDPKGTVDRMIEYFYSFDFSTEPVPDSFTGPLHLVAAMHTLADKYDVPHLMTLAVEKFKYYSHQPDAEELLAAIHCAFTTPGSNDSGLRATILDHWLIDGHQAALQPDPKCVEEFLCNTPEFAAALAIKFNRALQTSETKIRCSDCDKRQNFTMQEIWSGMNWCKQCDCLDVGIPESMSFTAKLQVKRY